MRSEAAARREDPRRTFGELVYAHTWRDVETDFIRIYPGDDEWVQQHGRVFHTLKTLTPRLSDLEIVIDLAEDEAGDVWVDVSGRQDEELVAIEFVDWAEWLGMTIDRTTSDRYRPAEIVAHCVWEMSFFGFDEETISQRWSEIEVLAEQGPGRRTRRR